MFKFACYFPAENPLFIAVNIESDAWVVELLKAIQMKLQLLGRDVSRRDLRLFKVNLFFLRQTANYPTPGGCPLGPRRRLAIARPPVAS